MLTARPRRPLAAGDASFASIRSLHNSAAKRLSLDTTNCGIDLLAHQAYRLTNAGPHFHKP